MEYRLEKISWAEYIPDEELLKLVEEERSLLTTIRTRKRNWMGHINERGLTSKRNNRTKNAG